MTRVARPERPTGDHGSWRIDWSIKILIDLDKNECLGILQLQCDNTPVWVLAAGCEVCCSNIELAIDHKPFIKIKRSP